MKSKKFDVLLAIGFAILLVISTIIAVVGIVNMIDTRNEYGKIFNVSAKIEQEALRSNTNLIAVHRAMKDVALSKTTTQFNQSMVDVNKYDQMIQSNFVKLHGFLGQDKMLNAVEKAYRDWKPIRMQTIAFALAKQYGLAAENTKTKGAAQVRLIEGKLKLLIKETQLEAQNTFNNANQLSRKAVEAMCYLALAMLLLGLLVAFLVGRALIRFRNKLHDEMELYKVTIDSIGDGVISVDMKKNVQNINKVAQKFTGWNFERARNIPFKTVFNITNSVTGEHAKDPLDQVIETDMPVELENHTILTSLSGVKRHIADSAAPIKNVHNKTIGAVIVFRDVTDEIKRLDEIKYLGYHDNLTGLYNRNYFNQELKKYDDEQYLPLSIILGDLNGLKLSNDVYGHETGDELLIRISEILTENCRDNDLIARIGGDEFAMVLPNTTREEANEINENIKSSCERSDFHPVNFKPIILSISLGICTRETMDRTMEETLKYAEDRMYTHKLLEGKSVRSTIIASLRNTLFERSNETELHAMRMTELANQLAVEVGLTKHEVDEIKLLTLLHDIGKIGISDNILNKEGQLTVEEWGEMKKHPEVGFRIAQSTTELAHIAELILTHHEHWDGGGYPQGLAGEEIPKLSRILALVDSYDVMTHDRPYRDKMTPAQAVKEIKRCAGTQFDPVLSKIFVEKVLKESWEVDTLEK